MVVHVPLRMNGKIVVPEAADSLKAGPTRAIDASSIVRMSVSLVPRASNRWCVASRRTWTNRRRESALRLKRVVPGRLAPGTTVSRAQIIFRRDHARCSGRRTYDRKRIL